MTYTHAHEVLSKCTFIIILHTLLLLMGILACCWEPSQVNFWDIRVDRLMKKGRKAADDSDLVWKPVHTVSLISLLGEFFFITTFKPLKSL
jgi:hypothetical protein